MESIQFTVDNIKEVGQFLNEDLKLIMNCIYRPDGNIPSDFYTQIAGITIKYKDYVVREGNDIVIYSEEEYLQAYGNKE
jgi:hypothetical protein